jgi:hypothetical protein
MEFDIGSFVHVLRHDIELNNTINEIKKECEVIKKHIQQATTGLKTVKKYGNGLYAKISKIYRENFMPTDRFTDEHEKALLDFIYVEKLGWKVDNSDHWWFDIQTQSRKSHLSYRDVAAGSCIRKVVADLKCKINSGKLKSCQQRKQVAS